MIENDTRKSAQGKWRGILKEFGLTDKELSGDHGPCPICAGNDRFRFTDYKGGGEYFCSGCGPGGGFDLLMKRNGWEFGPAAKRIDIVLGIGVQEVFKPKVDIEKRRRDLNRIWAGASQDHEFLDGYFESRGIEYDPDVMKDVRGHPSMFLAGSNEKHHAIVALIRNANGIPISIHRTYLNPKMRKIMPPIENISGGSIRLGLPGDDLLCIGEGLETTLSGMEEFGCAGFATISAQGMETVRVPRNYKTVVVLADNDHSFTGQKAAFTLARRLDNDGRHVMVEMSSKAGMDFNDKPADDDTEMWRWENEL